MFEGVDLAADEDADVGGEDVERGTWDGLEAIGAGIGVTTAGFDLQARGGEFEVPSDAVQDVWVGVGHFPIPGAGLLKKQPECFPLEIRRGLQRAQGIIVVMLPSELHTLAVPFDVRRIKGSGRTLN